MDETPKGSPWTGGNCDTPVRDDHSDERKNGEDSSDEEGGYCNPEPPKELIQDHPELIDADKIGDTVFSKQWVFSTLMKLIKTVETSVESKEQNEQGLDLDDSLQDELCKLWDMAMNDEVVAFLQEFKAVELLTSVIAKSQAPRATEICVGILGNMACSDVVCQEISSDGKAMDIIIILLEEPDPPTLVETARLMHVLLSNRSVSHIWLRRIKEDDKAYEALNFILKSSTNRPLLENTGEMIDKMLDLDDELCEMWSNEDFTGALLEAINQISTEPSNALETYLHIFQLLSTNEKGVKSLGRHKGALNEFLLKFLAMICDEEVIVIEGKENTLASAFSVLSVLFSGETFIKLNIEEEHKLIRYCLKVLESVYPKLHKEIYKSKSKSAEEHRRKRRQRASSTCSGSPRHSDSQERAISESSSITECKSETSLEEDYRVATETLYSTVSSLLADVVLVLSKTEGRGVPSSLSYLNNHCLRERLYVCAWTLKEQSTDELDFNFALKTIAERYNQDRLIRIIDDALS